jgi:predicted metal-dependent hydrolase
MIAFFILLIINLLLLSATREPQRLVEVKEKYRILREHLDETNNEKFHMLKRCVPITGILRMNGAVGYNTNKGGEIAVCLDGETNEIFHVLIHELAHCTVTEYEHSQKFWDNYIELRDICVVQDK